MPQPLDPELRQTHGRSVHGVRLQYAAVRGDRRGEFHEHGGAPCRLDAHTVGRQRTGNETYIVELATALAQRPDVEPIAYLDRDAAWPYPGPPALTRLRWSARADPVPPARPAFLVFERRGLGPVVRQAWPIMLWLLYAQAAGR